MISREAIGSHATLGQTMFFPLTSRASSLQMDRSILLEDQKVKFILLRPVKTQRNLQVQLWEKLSRSCWKNDYRKIFPLHLLCQQQYIHNWRFFSSRRRRYPLMRSLQHPNQKQHKNSASQHSISQLLRSFLPRWVYLQIWRHLQQKCQWK